MLQDTCKQRNTINKLNFSLKLLYRFGRLSLGALTTEYDRTSSMGGDQLNFFQVITCFKRILMESEILFTFLLKVVKKTGNKIGKPYIFTKYII